MESKESSRRRKYSGSFRIRLGGGASTEEVPKSPLINILGEKQIYILEGVASHLGGIWKFSVKGLAFGWEDSRIEEVIHNNQTIFTENNAQAATIRGE